VNEIALGVVGLGVHGTRYASHLLNGDVKDARLAAVCRRNRSKGEGFARANGISFYQDYGELISAPEVDAVVVVTPCASHLDVCRAALAAGKPVLVEKPVVGSLSEGADLAAALVSSGAPLMVAQTLRYNAVVRFIKRSLALVGRPIRFRIAIRRPPDARGTEPGAGGKRGCALEIGVHLVDALRWIFDDEPARVFCITDAVLTRGAEDFFTAELTLARSGIHCNIEASKCTSARSEPVGLTGDHGQVFGDARIGRLFRIQEAGCQEFETVKRVQTISAVLEDFVSCLIGGTPMSIPLEEGLRAVQIIEACYASARDGRFVEIPGKVSDDV
jgi:predicted dehydrogenase